MQAEFPGFLSCCPRRTQLSRWLPMALMSALLSCSTDPVEHPERGVSQQLAELRSNSISDVEYEITFDVPGAAEASVSGEVTIRFELTAPLQNLVFDFRAPRSHTHAVLVNGSETTYTVTGDHILVPADKLREGRHAVKISFRSTDAALNRQADFMYTLFVPDRAATAFPLFDQPDIKARYRLTLTVPSSWQALANGELLSRTAVVGGQGTDRLEFAETLPISSYLFAFAAGDLQIAVAERDGRQYRLFHRETDSLSLARNSDVIFDLHAASMAWLEQYTGIGYPFGKFDFFAIPAFQFGGMEHPGAIWYRAESLFLDPGATRNQELGRASLIAHETAHMWFGDLVTMRWFNDVWMKEVFANFMAAKIAGPAFPDLDLRLRFFLAHHPAAYDVDRTAGANPIRQRLDNLIDAGSLYGAIIYQKAPVVMQQLELMMGEGPLQQGLQRYLQEFSFGNADWQDLITILDPLTGTDLQAWSQTWVDEPGRPRLTANWSQGRLELTQSDDRVGRHLRWQQPVALALAYGDQLAIQHLVLSSDAVSVDLADMRQPDFILPGMDGVSYARFELDDRSRAALLESIHTLSAALHRAVSWQHLWEELLEGRLHGSGLIDTLLVAVETERDPQVAQQVLGLLRAVWWRYLSPEQRQVYAPGLESVLWQALSDASTAGEKGAYFSALVALTQTDEGLATLLRIWQTEQRVEGLPLQEQQFINLAEMLALRDHPRAEDILDEQRARITNPDRLARFDFVRSALSADPEIRSAKFLSFGEHENRRQESWVLDSARLIHHPLRAQSAESLILPGLEMLEDIKATGDIFFPLRWLNAVLDGHRSLTAAHVVTEFAEQRQDMEAKLRDKLLQAADGLIRAARNSAYPANLH
jgi:aminopeptidase N